MHHAEKVFEHKNIVDRLFGILFGIFPWYDDELVLVSDIVNYWIAESSIQPSGSGHRQASVSMLQWITLASALERLLSYEPSLVVKNISSLTVSSSRASKRRVSVSEAVKGCKILLLRSLEPIGVRVSLSNPNKQSFDLVFSKFWMSSKERIVEMSIIIDPSDGSYLILKEWNGNVVDIPSSMYLSA